MKITELSLPGAKLIEPSVFGDERGYFMETFSAARYESAGIDASFVQDNVSRSQRGVLRGLHLQHPHAQAKLVSVLDGEVFDVIVDVRIGSPTFGRWHGEYLSSDNKLQLYVPAGFAHGFCVTSDIALFAYKCTAYYQPKCERTIRWDDRRIGIEWPITTVELSTKDRAGVRLESLDSELLPSYETRAAASSWGAPRSSFIQPEMR
jgi:dTDP-4-dehydrorhamnose 3,5-epimerase